MKIYSKNAIALLITLFFIMLITLSIGVSLKYINEGSKEVNKEQFILQSNVILEDVLEILKKSPDLEQIKTPSDLSLFLLSTEFIPIQNNAIDVVIKFKSARSKFNPNFLKEARVLETFKNFLVSKGVNPSYADLLYDSVNGIKEDQTYSTNIFIENPLAFRDYIASRKHLEAINQFFVNSYHETSIYTLDMDTLFYFSNDTNSSIDLNQATALTYELILSCDEQRAMALSGLENSYEKVEDMGLSEQEKINLARFKTSFFEPYLDVEIQIRQNNQTSSIRFEYNIESKKGSNFVFEV